MVVGSDALEDVSSVSVGKQQVEDEEVVLSRGGEVQASATVAPQSTV